MVLCLFFSVLFGGAAVFCFRRHLALGDWWCMPGAAVAGFISAVCLLTLLLIGKGLLLTVIRIGIMCAAGGGVVVGWKQYRFNKKQWGQTLTIVSFCVAMLFAYIHFRGQSAPSARNAINAESEFQNVAARVLGRHLAEKYGGGRAVVVCEPSALADQGMPAESYRALKRELERDMTVAAELVAQPKMTDELRKQLEGYLVGAPGDGQAEAMSPEEAVSLVPRTVWWTAERFDEVLVDMPDCDVIVCTAPPPASLTETAIWRNEDRPKFAFALNASSPDLIPHVQSGDVVAMVQRKEGAAFFSMEAPPRDLEKAFAARYVLVTPASASQ